MRLPQTKSELLPFVRDHAQTTATLNTKFYRVRSIGDGPGNFKIEAVEYVNPTGLAASTSNYFTIALKKGSTVMASWSTRTADQGALVANTFVTLVNSATPANLWAASLDELSLDLALTGTQTLPPGTLIVHARYF